ncbi:hypothetical protein QM480_00110 [Flectobacillus sp. DC10W]|uniref:Uncharacterized protein n=1 Tax=Flectobacillus longus TaxID=2984207 RepID=A0ABT6YGQ2_9BACT|nr:hypothetical protein [Flectobacillus longus]MDI9862705.1 hypothetical protein [Flectobacillus longus]
MLFDTEKKADNFIAFNQEEIRNEAGYAPQRSYFCLFCGGWHITSIKEDIGKSKNEELLEKLLIEKANKKEKTPYEKFKINHQENRNKLFLEIESKIKELDNNEKELFFKEQISFLNKEIEEISNSTNQNDKELLRELRQKLDVTYIVRKQNGFQKVNNKFNEKLEEEWLSWLKKNGKP